MTKRHADNTTLEELIRLRKENARYKQGLETIIAAAEDPLAVDNPHLIAYMWCAKIAKKYLKEDV